MNDIKYKVSGSTHKNGTLATSRHTWLVVAKSNTEGTIANPNHKRQVPQDAAGASRRSARETLAGTVRLWAAIPHTLIAQKTANSPKLQDQIRANIGVEKIHSKTAGKLIRARSEAALESAYKR